MPTSRRAARGASTSSPMGGAGSAYLLMSASSRVPAEPSHCLRGISTRREWAGEAALLRRSGMDARQLLDGAGPGSAGTSTQSNALRATHMGRPRGRLGRLTLLIVAIQREKMGDAQTALYGWKGRAGTTPGTTRASTIAPRSW